MLGAPPLPPPVLKVLYRSLLRASRNGRRPEVFGLHANAASSAWRKRSPGTTISAAAAAAEEGADDDGSNVDGGTGDASPNQRVSRPLLPLHERLPSTPAQVRRALREAFAAPPPHPPTSSTTTAATIMEEEAAEPRSSHEPIDPFAVLRSSNEVASILAPSAGSLPATLPIFDYASTVLLPGEEGQFHFFEPRYRMLANLALTKGEGRRGGGGYFLLRAGSPPRGGATLVKIVESMELPNGNVAVRCLAGPRVFVTEENEVQVDDKFAGGRGGGGGSDGSQPPHDAPLALATSFSVGMWLVDDPHRIGSAEKNEEGDEADMIRTRKRILDLLDALTSDFDQTVVEQCGLPPIDVEMFSFYALRFVLSPDDVASRLRWLYRCHHPAERMEHVLGYLEQYQDIKETRIRDMNE